jgi:hypothetical protein
MPKWYGLQGLIIIIIDRCVHSGDLASTSACCGASIIQDVSDNPTRKVVTYNFVSWVINGVTPSSSYACAYAQGCVSQGCDPVHSLPHHCMLTYGWAVLAADAALPQAHCARQHLQAQPSISWQPTRARTAKLSASTNIMTRRHPFEHRILNSLSNGSPGVSSMQACLIKFRT